MTDNGFGTKYNRPDYLLRLYLISPDAKTAAAGSCEVEIDARFIQLRDPDQKVPFMIVHEFSRERLLTGFDFDIESFVIAEDGTLWIGDEFGPFLLHLDATGKLLEAPYATPDFTEGSDPAKPRWKPRVVPLRSGIVPWPDVFAALRHVGFAGWLSIHAEYAGLSPEDVVSQTRDDLNYLNAVLREQETASR